MRVKIYDGYENTYDGHKTTDGSPKKRNKIETTGIKTDYGLNAKGTRVKTDVRQKDIHTT